MKTISGPIDQDENVIALLVKFGGGEKFSQSQMMTVLNKPQNWVRRFSRELREVLQECPEGLQLEVSKGGHRFGCEG